MLIEHRGKGPRVDPSAYVAPTAAICGAVRIGPGARVLFGAVLTAEDGQVSLGARTIVMENAVIRGRARHPAVIGDDVLVGPHAHVNGARVGDGCFLATGASLFPGCIAGPGSEVRVGGVVQVKPSCRRGPRSPSDGLPSVIRRRSTRQASTSGSGQSRSRWISREPSTVWAATRQQPSGWPGSRRGSQPR